ncbi:MAG TPA: M23 family metallopeptidase, partial [Symbiobacteriaceae bacterium]|nr:M23 family metallopeptidase [Symbiobacteriaceae bacterium]
AGTVVHAGWMVGGYGYTVVIDHGYGFTTLYAHFDEVNSSVGDVVSRGDVIGWVGSTGNSTGPHVHYEVHVNGVPVDPMRYAQ